MFSKIYSGGIKGIEGCVIQVESDVSHGLPGFQLVGYLSSEVKEAQERVRTALKNSGFHLPPMKITINLSPANIRKEGTGFDLPIAIAVLSAHNMLRCSDFLSESAFVGELGLDGSVKPICGTLSLVAAFRDAGIKHCFLPKENALEGLAMDGIGIVPVKNLKDLVYHLNHPDVPFPEDSHVRFISEYKGIYSMDYKEVQGQVLAKRATEIAVAGRHNILYIGPAGSGKSMIARRIPTIMPPLSHREQMEVSKIYSVCGLLPKGEAMVQERPFRNPHHTISPQALTGGGKNLKPGEITLASRGVLFLDEFPEFQRRTIEVLRQPLEEKKITVSRIQGSCEFPADFMLAAAMNPCPCGFYPDRNKCSCQVQQIQRYLGKISRPLLDRIDICVEAAPISFQEAHGEMNQRHNFKNESSADIQKRVNDAWQIQKKRFEEKGSCFNSEMGNGDVRKFCKLGAEEVRYLEHQFQIMGLSARGYQRVLRVARTIADLAGSASIQMIHLQEAIGYRSLEGKYWEVPGGKTHE